MHTTLERLQAEFTAKMAGLDAVETQMRPAGRPNAWTLQQIVEHLMLTYTSTAKSMKLRLERGSATKARATATNCAAQFVIGRLGYFPAVRKAPDMVDPCESKTIMNGEQLKEAFTASSSAMDRVLTEVERALGTGRAVSHPILGPMSVANWRRFHLAHGRHHLKQVRAILKSGSPQQSEAVVQSLDGHLNG